MLTEFWDIIGSNTLTTRADVDAALERVSARLAPLAPYDLVNFVRDLREAIDKLGRAEFAAVPVNVRGFVHPQSYDHFEYARCACVLAGREAFADVLASGKGFERFTPPELQAEELLYIANRHYTDKMGFPMS